MSVTIAQSPVTATVDSLELVGPIVRLQVQTSSLKYGNRPHSWYNPEFIRQVPEIRIDGGGATGVDGVEIADVHHRDHPQSKFRGENGISIGCTGHYTHMRARFGDHLRDGIAGETMLVSTDREYTEDEVANGIVVVGASGQIGLNAVQVAAPCVEFSKFCAGYAVDQKADAVIAETLRFLHQGMRGFYATLADDTTTPVTVSLGDTVYRIVSSVRPPGLVPSSFPMPGAC